VSSILFIEIITETIFNQEMMIKTVYSTVYSIQPSNRFRHMRDTIKVSLYRSALIPGNQIIKSSSEFWISFKKKHGMKLE